MNKIHADLFAVMIRFPDCKEALKKLFLKSKEFQGMCEDYRKCREALDYWNQPEIKHGLIHREEYAALLQELESEIIQKLDENI